MSFLKGKFKWIFSVILTVFLMMSSFLGCNLEEINSFLGEEETTTVQNQEETSTQNEDETSVQKQDNNSKESENEKSLEVFENKEYSSKEEVSAIIEQGGSIETVFEIVPPNLKTAFVVNKAIVS